MRLVVLMIPIALVGGYVVHRLANQATHTTAELPPPPAARVAPVSAVAPVSPAPPIARLAGVDAPAHAEFDTEVADGQLRMRGAASASMVAAVEGALQLVSQRLADGDSLDAELVAELVTWSATLLADVAADVEGYIEIETPDGERIVIGGAGRPTVRVETR